MMRLIPATFLVGLLLGCGARPQAAGEADPPDLLVRWQFAGTDALAGDTNGAALRAVLAKPATRALLEETREKLAAAPLTKPLAPLLPDLFRARAFVEARGEPQTPEWTFALRLSPERAAVWEATWSNLAPAWDRAAARVIRVGDWVVAGVGAAPLRGLEAVRQRLTQHGRPGVHEEPGAWLELEAQLARLASLLNWPTTVPWPRVRLTVAGRGPHLRTVGRLTYERPLDLPLEPWRVPTNTIRDPLVSFTALQGVRPWLAAHPLVRELDLPAPNQVFAWAQSLVPYLTQIAWEMPEAASRLPGLKTNLPAALQARLPWLDFGELLYVPAKHRLAWSGFPIVVPHLNPAPDPGFVTAGLFPVETAQPPAPDELYAQILGRTNLVLYHWEITQPRLADWRELRLLYDMVAGYAPGPTNTAATRWLQDTNVTRHLGNAVTEITRVSPRELVLLRSSSIGLTAFEIHWVARWLDGRRFPLLSPPVRLIGASRSGAPAGSPPSPPPR